MSENPYNSPGATAFDEQIVRLDWDELARNERETLERRFDEVGAMLAQAYIALHERGEITEAHLSEILGAFDRIDELSSEEFGAVIRGVGGKEEAS